VALGLGHVREDDHPPGFAPAEGEAFRRQSVGATVVLEPENRVLGREEAVQWGYCLGEGPALVGGQYWKQLPGGVGVVADVSLAVEVDGRRLDVGSQPNHLEAFGDHVEDPHGEGRHPEWLVADVDQEVGRFREYIRADGQGRQRDGGGQGAGALARLEEQLEEHEVVDDRE
jgi:hypothetical protein